MKVQEVCEYIQSRLGDCPSVQYESRVILSMIIDCPVNDIFFHKDIDDEQWETVKDIMDKVCEGLPLQKAIGFAYFFGNRFAVDNDVLTPRFDTENLVEVALKELRERGGGRVLDLCCGSGCVGISIAKADCNAEVVASDISEKALKIASLNAITNNVSVEFVHSDMFQNIIGKFDIIVSNPPYIPSEEVDTLDEEVAKYDPRISLDGGSDGLDFYRKISKNARDFLTANGMLCVEIGFNQGKQVYDIMKEIFISVEVLKDIANNDRIVIGRNIRR